jgi:hypothetical protein
MVRRRLVLLATLGAALSLSSPARALDAEVTSDTSAQFYDVRSPSGATVLARRRLITTLGVATYNLLEPYDAVPRGPELTFRARMRYDADYGAFADEVDVTNRNARLVPGFSRGPVDLMYGYVEGRRFLKGWLGFKLGRQYQTDSLGWWSFDGGLVRITTPYYFQVEGYGGLEVRGGMPLSTPRFEREGIWRGDRTGYDPALWPSFQPNDVAPAYGFAVESSGPTFLHGRFSYRKVYNTGSSNLSQFQSGLFTPASYEGSRVSQERIGYAIDANLFDVVGAKGGITYDLYLAQVPSMYASFDGYVSQRLTLSLDYDYYRPTFDADSIFNVFDRWPMNDIGARASWDATDKLSVAGGAHTRILSVATEPSGARDASPSTANANEPAFYPTSSNQFDVGGNLAGTYKWGEGKIGLRGNGLFSKGGDRVGADMFAERVLETRYILSGRASLWHWNDKLREDRDATGFGYVAGLGYKFAERSNATFEFDHNINRLVGHRFRVMLWLSLAVTK